ncbi:PREDICTED: probably inactive leucine-rich repeat receptor-like protein kinase IMK2 [Tarenaya hassleriana]|uniref:probably inactive leucine-rich repeat receptor-like protein kinase IMK2 n=1 Tax=Tarenaya hassleriana TaxID=28532 RepID=UPI00053C1F99|nr:PREDICTED: probably inactive leucine-rich repeat receptor-like protein kinase IMK2 [Tarenaya hassleriana]
MNGFYKNPSRVLPKGGKSYRLHLGFFTNLLFCLSLFTPQAIAGHHPLDGVIVTQANYQALRAIKHDLIDFAGILRTWNDSGHGVCSGGWAGIRCLRGQVIAIQLPWKGLGGRISEEVGKLTALRKLSLHDNVIAGSIPQSLGFLRNLRGVHLFNNRLSGSIPASIGNCPLLQNLDLSNNQLSGSIPSRLAVSTRLYRLNLSYNSLSGPLPVSLTRPYTLTFLDLQHNNLSGSIPVSWGDQTLRNESHPLKILNLNHNLFSGTVPPSLGKLVLLEHVSLDHNQISGVVPRELGTLSNLQNLDLSFNSIIGTIPNSFTNLSSLALLNLENNRLNGRIPEAIDGMQNLILLNLKRNKFEGRIPETIGNISRISQLDLSENNFTGQIPQSLINLANLSSLNVSFNSLSGPVPPPLARKFNSSSFVGNLQLCGFNASNPCPSPTHPPNLSPPAETQQPQKHHHHHRKLSAKDIILIAIGALLAVLLLLCCILLYCLMKKRSALKQKEGKISTRSAPEKAAESAAGGEMGGKLVHFEGPFVFTADDLLCATAEIMGKSAYGTVYKTTLEDGNEVAVKRLREKNTKGVKEFEAEVAALGKIRHPNLLALRAYYLGPKGEKLIVFDYMPKGSLSSFLHARGPESLIPWETRMKIAKGIARGLSHLHTKENMVHENLTASNILLDEQTNALIADYGLSSLMTAAAATNVIATAGTLGYRAPEFSKMKYASTKTDVYSLGVIILELLTGKSPGETTNGLDLPQWVASVVKEEWTGEVFDLELMREAQHVRDELLNTLKMALHCVDPSPEARPEALEVLQQLEEIQPELAEILPDPATETVEAAGSGDGEAEEHTYKG